MLITSIGQRIVVRFRKPIWMPTAPSKLFRIAEHTFYDKEEIKQINLLRIAYQAQMESIEKFMNKEFYIPATQSGGIPADFLERELEEDKKNYAENDKINAEVAKRREKYFEDRVRKMEDKVMEEKFAIEEALIEAGQKMSEFVRTTKSVPNSFVTPENIDELIETAMENPVSFEFCIDRRGKKYGQSKASQESSQASINN